jgi:hypothetical protein
MVIFPDVGSLAGLGALEGKQKRGAMLSAFIRDAIFVPVHTRKELSSLKFPIF